MIKNIKLVAQFCLLSTLLNCNGKSHETEIIQLQNEIQTLRDSLHSVNNYNIRFSSVETIAHSRDSIFQLGKQYIFDCYLAGKGLIFDGDTMAMQMVGKSKNGNNISFSEENGNIKMHYNPSIIGLDTLQLEYLLNPNKNKDGIKFQKDLTVLVLK